MSTAHKQTFTFVTAASDKGGRVDRVVTDRLTDLSRSRVRQLIDDGLLTVNGVAVRPSYRVAEDDTVAVTIPEVPPADALVADAGLPLDVIHSDAEVIVLDKPAGQVVHPAAGHTDDTTVNALLAKFPDLAEAFASPRPGLVHRLDRDTTGLIVVARTEKAAESLRAQFKARTVEKVYLAVAKGQVTPPEGLIDAPIGRDPRQRKKMTAMSGGRPSQTAYRVLDVAGNHSLVEARPLTGRTHQIRVHLDAIGFPVAGDTVYGKRDPHISRLALHALRLSFDHPATGERVTFEAPIPDDMREAMTELRLQLPEG